MFERRNKSPLEVGFNEGLPDGVAEAYKERLEQLEKQNVSTVSNKPF